MNPFKRTPTFAVSAILLSLPLVVSCGTKNSPYSSDQIIQSHAQLEAIVSFIDIGETTLDEVTTALGEGDFGFRNGEEGYTRVFVWESIPFTLDEGEGAFGLFSPDPWNPSESKIASEAYLLVEYNSDQVVIDVHFRGPTFKDETSR